jgi:hypothetical protein
MSNQENQQQEEDARSLQPESLFPSDRMSEVSNQPEEAMIALPPPQAEQTPPLSAYYTIDDQASGSMLYDPWATVSAPAASSSATAAAPLPSPQRGGQGFLVGVGGRFTRSRLLSFAAVMLAVVVVFGGVMFAVVQSFAAPAAPVAPNKPVVMQQQQAQSQAGPAAGMTPMPAAPTTTQPPTPAPAVAMATPAAAAAPAQQPQGDTGNGGGAPPAQAAAVNLQDTFQRTVPMGWGTAQPTGQQWTIATGNPQSYSVTAGIGQIVASDTQQTTTFYTATLGPTSNAGTTVDVSATFSTLGLSFPNNQVNMGVIARWSQQQQGQQSYYKAYLDGTALVIMRSAGGQQMALAQQPLSATDTTFYTVRLRIQGQTLMAKAWEARLPEPATWMVQAQDNGAGLLTTGKVGVRAMLPASTFVQVRRFQASE